ncbi:isochorismatase family protein [Tomitella cavernea]|uniref:Isochorismatase-like domain-containing protein n=1 Tax=Tomitella cavernea TaxID=1387982 RepID=A0ABP9D2Y3_9ACTN|nr:isochorismatase family protein [Tomitella cavernea]
MSIPAIHPYTAPAADLDANRADWRPEPGRCALLIHDMQQYFLDAYDPAQEPIPELYRNIAALRAACADRGIPVLYSAQPGGQDLARRGLLADFWGEGMADDPAQTRIVDALAPGPDDIVITKWRYSAFQRTELADVLRFQRRDQLIITGVYAHLGCLATATEAFMRDIRPFFVADAVADFTADEHRMAVDYAARRCAAVTTTARLVDALTPALQH